MLQFRNVLFVFILSLVHLSSAVRLRRREAPTQGNDLSLKTNAARMAAGLGPLPPRRADPTRVAAKRAQPSGNPCTSYTSDYIKVYRSSNAAFLGYIKKTTTVGGVYTLTTGQGSALMVSFSVCDSSSPISISIDGALAPNSYLGFTGTNINTGTSSSAILAPVKNTPANSPPDNTMESTVWQFALNHITAQWVNVDSSKPPTYLYYTSTTGYIQITADPTKFTQQYPASYAVYLVVSNTA